jgi:four helix bundle protein
MASNRVAAHARSMARFDHEKLDVYRVAIDFVVLANDLCATITGRAALSDQLQRASTSITLNIAEGAGEFSKAEKRRFYRIARRSATECAAVLDVLRCCNLVDDDEKLQQPRQLLLRIVAMLTRLIVGRTHSPSGLGSGSGAFTGQDR